MSVGKRHLTDASTTVGTLRGVLAFVALAFIVVPLVEIYVIVLVGRAIGALDTIGLLLAFSLVGAWLAKHEGFWVMTRMREQLDAGRMPTNELIDGGLVLAGGILLLAPGFVTDGVGLLFLFPPSRALARVLLKRRFRGRVTRYDVWPGPRDDGPDDVIDV